MAAAAGLVESAGGEGGEGDRSREGDDGAWREGDGRWRLVVSVRIGSGSSLDLASAPYLQSVIDMFVKN